MSINVYCILYPDYVSVRPGSSTNGLFSDSDRYKFGVVDAVNYANVRTNVGNSVLFDTSRAAVVTQSNSVNTWYVIHEEDIIFKEVTVP